MTQEHQFDTTDKLVRIVIPFGSVIWAASQLPGANERGGWFLAAVIVFGLFIGFNQSIEALDRRLNSELYREDVITWK